MHIVVVSKQGMHVAKCWVPMITWLNAALSHVYSNHRKAMYYVYYTSIMHIVCF